MKKLLITLLSVCMLFCACFMLACNNDGEPDEQPSVEKHTHDLEKVSANESTCTENGNVEYWECSSCNKKFSDQNGENEITNIEIIAFGHDFTNYVSDNNATCLENGTETATCNRDGCSQTDTRTEEESVLGHDIENHSAQEPTCTEIGWEAYETCSRCDYSTYEEISTIGHEFTNYVSDNNATCLEDGTETATCNNGCNQTSTKTEENSRLGHEFTNYVSDNNATFFDNGTKTAQCQHDNCVEVDTIIDENSQIMTELPFFYINTENNENIASKEDYIKCSVSLFNTDYNYEFTEQEGKIKGRGNSTWGAPKKPYKLKFDKKVDLFGNGAAKTWTILANYYDKSQMRNYLAFGVADLFDSQNMCSSTHFVNLFVNGEFYGIYLICEQIEVADTRVEVDESYDNVDTGYLIELDGRAPSEGVLDRDYFVLNGRNYAIKSPDTEDESFTSEHVEFIKNYMSNTMTYLEGTQNWEELSALIDVESFAESYIIQELFHNADVGYSSFYMYKKENGKLYGGPVWDFDLSAGFYQYSPLGEHFYNPEAHYACVSNPWYRNLVKYDEFNALVGEILNKKTDDIVELITTKCDFILSMEQSFSNEFILWEESENGWKVEVNELKEWLIKSISFLNDYYSQYI